MTTLNGMDPPLTASATGKPATAAAWYGLFVLTLITLFATVDRQIFILLAQPIKAAINLSDFDLGLLQGLGLVVFSTLASYPIAWAADRMNRRFVMAGCIAIWSIAVALCGLVQSFPQIFIASALVGAGAAGISPIVYSLVPELFRGDQRQLANSIYTVSATVGGGLAIALCGYVIALAETLAPRLPLGLDHFEGWRLAFLFAALPGPLFLVLILSIRLPLGRPATPDQVPSSDAPIVQPAAPVSLPIYFKTHRRTLVPFILGVGLVGISGSSVGVWLPQVAIRRFGATMIEVGNGFGLATTVAAVIGLVVSVTGVRLLRKRVGAKTPVIIIALAAIGGAASIGLTLLASTSTQLFLAFMVHQACIATGSMVYPSAVQDVAPAAIRARMTAITSMVLFVFLALGPPLVGGLSDRMQAAGGSALLPSLVWTVIAALALCALLMVLTLRTYAATTEAAAMIDEVQSNA